MSTRISLLLFLSFFTNLAFAQSDTVRLELATKTATTTNEVVCLPLVADGMDGILSAQFSLIWDTSRLAINGIELGDNPLLISGGQYNIAADTAIGVAWTTPDGNPVTIPDQSVLFEVCFINKATSGFSSVTFEGWLEPEFAVGPPIALAAYEITPGGVAMEPASVATMYPGDTNADSVVNYLDILPIGLAYGEVGPVRPGGSLAFSEQPAPSWPQSLPISNTNYRHIDANGDGQIGNADASVVANNYGAAIDPLWEEAPPAAPRQLVPRLYVKADTVIGGQTSVLEVYLEDGANPIEVYGLGFSVAYDADQVVAGTFDVDYSSSFFRGDGASLLTLDRELSAAGQWHIAQTRRNKSNIAGQGLIARISFQSVSVTPGTIAELPISIGGIRLVSSDEFVTTVTGETTVIGIEGTTPTQEPEWSQELNVYPNPLPAGTALTLATPAGVTLRYQLFDYRGRLLRAGQAQAGPFDLSGLAKGSYLLRFVDRDGRFATREILKF